MARYSSGTGEEQEDAAAIDRYRAAKNFRRRVDGRVLLHGKDSDTWLEAKLDGYVEGSLLLLGQDGLVYYLVSEDLKQIDLSNDQLVGQLFGEGGWEKLMQPLYTQITGGELKHVRMTPQQFRSIFTVLREAPPPTPTGRLCGPRPAGARHTAAPGGPFPARLGRCCSLLVFSKVCSPEVDEGVGGGISVKRDRCVALRGGVVCCGANRMWDVSFGNMFLTVVKRLESAQSQCCCLLWHLLSRAACSCIVCAARTG
ncbi:hypothetical protein VOLCADRAFT_106357 [Volvox carteri f. nagariensis]|uniref:Uncharacterized protein n=1 Tax=Volvox carteri f. nagariensis TaxID=3068 RepID=D8U6U9_VOLCA|nr:uncharacterized protein VOLCADRAFT_106357 [Volvox carteri f. nagariensis]EFJ44575.1 hypothetical protein VOLCADRAFT_106357 [Volvox carteri f. nagariensis]|eukprot:XP_002954425.1 hypothetical protein VOLCADRAFT_106357 [Volvox carteri f. nagariensis]